jgi:hypothetical protein
MNDHMKSGTTTAAAVAAGYLLGRRRKMRLAIMLAAAAASGRLGVSGSQLLRRVLGGGAGEALGRLGPGVGKLAPELGKIGDSVRGDLTEAGKAAVVAALSSRIESISDTLHERAESVRADDGPASDRSARRLRAGGEEPEEAEPAEEAEPEEEWEDEQAEPAGDEWEEEPEEEEPEEEPEPERPRARRSRGPRRTSSAGARRSPVRRTGR